MIELKIRTVKCTVSNFWWCTFFNKRQMMELSICGKEIQLTGAAKHLFYFQFVDQLEMILSYMIKKMVVK